MLDELVREFFCCCIDNVKCFIGFEYLLYDGLCEVCFAESYVAVNEQWVERGFAWFLADGLCSGLGKLVAVAYDEVFERELWVEVYAVFEPVWLCVFGWMVLGWERMFFSSAIKYFVG